MAEKKKYNSILVSGRKDQTLTYSKFVKDEESGESVKESLDKKVNVTDELTTQQIKDGAITNEKMAADSVGNTNLQDGSVSNEKLEDGSITNEKLAENSITKDKLKDNTIGVEKLDPELRQTINAATGLPENLVETIQNVDDTLKDHQRQLDDKQQQITANDEDISLLQTRSTQMEETIKDIAATGGASQATAVTYDNEKSKLSAVNIQSAVDEVVDKTAIKDEEGTVVETPFRYIQNEEFIFAKVDAEDKLLFGFHRNGTPVFGKTSAVEDRLQSQVNLLADKITSILGDDNTTSAIDTLKELKDFFANIDNTQTLTSILTNLNNVSTKLGEDIKNLQDTKVDKEEGKSLIEDEVKECFRVIENEEFIKAITDADDRVLFGIYRDTGKPYYPQNDMYHISQSEEFLWVILDAANHPLLGILQDGTCWAAKAQWLDDIKAIKEALKTFQPKEDGKGLINLDVADSFFYISNDEYIIAVVDAENRILAGIKYDGKPYFPNHEMYSVITNEEWLYVIIDTENKVLGGFRADDGHMIVGGIDISTFISDAIIDISDIKERTAHLSTIVNDEYLSAETDAEGKVIGYIASDGSHYLYKVKSETIPTEFEHIEDLENRIEMTIDAEGKVLGYRKSNGTRYEKSLDVQSLKISGSSIENVINESIEKIQLSNINGVEDFGKENLYTGYTKRYTTADGKQTFISPNESIGGVFCNPIRCSAGDYFTRTGIATAIIVVSDKNDNNAQRLYQADGSLPGNTFQIPNGWDWAYYVRCVCMSTDTELAIMRGKYAVKKSDQDGKLRIPNMKLSAANFTKETKFISSPNGSMYEIAVNNNGELYAKPVDKDIVFAGDIPSNLTYSLINNLSDSESIPFDRFVCAIGSYATVFKGTGLTSYKDFSPLAMNSNIEHHYNSANEGRYVVLISVGNKRGLYVYDDDWKLIDCLIQDIDQHDFIYIDDFHYIVFKNTHVECEKDGKTVTLLLPCIYEYKNGKVIASRLLNDKIITDDIYMFSFEQGTHLNTMRFDGDDQTKIILNARHNMSFYILERKVSNDGAVTFGNILYQVGGLHSAKNYDIESRIKTPDECQWFLCHDVKRWGNKEINGISYPVYTLFDNNTKWSINPRNGGNGTDKNVNSRIVQMAIDFANKKIVEYKCYYIEGYYSDIMSSAIMFNEGVLFVDYARKPMAGLYDYTTEVTEHVGNTYKNAKKLLEFYSGTQTPYRVNTFNLK